MTQTHRDWRLVNRGLWFLALRAGTLDSRALVEREQRGLEGPLHQGSRAEGV